MKKNRLIIFAVAGFLFRWWLISLVPQPFGWDQSEYESFAYQIMEKGLVAWQARLYGYPLVLAFVYKFLALGNEQYFDLAVRVFQAILDSATAVFVFLTGRHIFKRETPAWLAYFLYLFNPFTSSFVGLYLSETTAIFLMAAVFFLIILFLGKKNFKYLLPLGLTLGFLPQVRQSFGFFTLVVVIVLIFIIARTREFQNKILVSLVFLFLYFLPFSYNLVGNLRYFGQFSLTTVDNLFVREFYISLYIPRHASLRITSPAVLPKEVQEIYQEFSVVPKNKEERKLMAQKYLNLALIKVKEDPLKFIISRFGKLWYVWEKHSIFCYQQPDNIFFDFLTYWGNVFFLVTALLGFTSWFGQVREEKQGDSRWFAALTVLLVFYISAAHSFSPADERYSLLGYPLIFLFAGLGIWQIFFPIELL